MAVDACTRGEPRRELGSRVHGGLSPRGYAPIKSEPPVQDPTALDVCVRDAVAGAPEKLVARRRVAAARRRSLSTTFPATKLTTGRCIV
jgi:hypothetical protein